jgi:argininosuccinate lyase
MEQQLYATQDAYKLVTDEGLPFREAYRRVGETLRQLRGKPEEKDEG